MLKFVHAVASNAISMDQETAGKATAGLSYALETIRWSSTEPAAPDAAVSATKMTSAVGSVARAL